MENGLLTRAADFLLARRRRKRWQKIVSGMASVVVFCTTYALILPAITMSNELICGLEAHTHTEECWTTEVRYPQSSMACTFTAEGAVAHEHDRLCRSEDGTLICTMDQIPPHSGLLPGGKKPDLHGRGRPGPRPRRNLLHPGPGRADLHPGGGGRPPP